ncbi:hypothetical protein [Streptomyces sp. WAC 06783]|uniref:hypothetical protein n=1 Tax=Streptomyces sp. WAC 06783 TaxID=2203211 RepID=UPI0021ADB064|nr:hypothetical protein [Streptomyces sp. WAC 06783]
MYAYAFIDFKAMRSIARRRNQEHNGSTGRIASSKSSGIPSGTRRRSNSELS